MPTRLTGNTDPGVTSPVIRKMLERFRLSADAEADNRKRGLEALKFRRGGEYQWDDRMLGLRREDNRPSDSYNQIPQFVHQVTNDMRLNMSQIKFLPGEDGDQEVAEVYEDLARSIQSTSEAEVAYDTAADSQVTIGWGYYRFLTEYESEKTFDQVIKIGWVPNTFTVYDDPLTYLQDRSDRKYLIQVMDQNVDDFNHENDKEYDSSTLESIGDHAPEWAGEKTVRVAEYWTVEEETSLLYRMKKSGKVSTTKPTTAPNTWESRTVIIPKVKWRKCTAMEVLEERDWAGKYIPYVFVSGEELIIDGKKYYSGIVEQMMAPQRQYNYWTNAATEMVALAPRAPFIAAVGQIDGSLAQFWDSANIKNYPYLPYNPIDVNGTTLPAPQRAQNSADIGSMMAMVQQAQQNFYATTGIYPASLGQVSNEKSGKAIMARQREGDVSTFHFSDNEARGKRFAGRVLADLMPKIYDGPRSLRLTKEDKTSREVRVNQSFKDKDGKTKKFDLTVGTYDIAVTTGPSFTTKRQEASETQVQIAQAYPQLMEIAGDIVVGNMDWPGAAEIAERIKKTLPPQLLEEPEEGQVPPQIVAQMQQMQAVIEQMSAQLQQAQQELQSKQADLQLKAADLQAKQQDMQLSAQSDQIKAETDRMRLQLDAEKLQLQREQMAMDQRAEESKLMLERYKVEMDHRIEMVKASPEMALSDPEMHNGQTPPMVGMMEQLSSSLQAGLERIAEITAESNQAVIESNAMVAQAIAQPKAVLRDEQGRIAGVA